MISVGPSERRERVRDEKQVRGTRRKVKGRALEPGKTIKPRESHRKISVGLSRLGRRQDGRRADQRYLFPAQIHKLDRTHLFQYLLVPLPGNVS